MDGNRKPVHWLSGDLKARFGGRVTKVALDVGGTCPNRDGSKGRGGCAWCDEGGSGPDGPDRLLPWREALERGVKIALERGAVGAIAYFQAFTSTYAKADEISILGEKSLSVPGVIGLAFGARPDCLEEDVLDCLSGFRKRTFLWVEVGMQTMHDSTLAAMNRGHSHAATEAACDMLQRRGIPFVLHLIAGLPGETKEMMRASFDEAARLKPWGVKLHPLHVVKGSMLEAPYGRGELPLLEMGEYASLAADMLERISPETTIHRLTGERPAGVLVAPAWCMEKRKVLAAIQKELAARGSCQGILAREDSPPRHQDTKGRITGRTGR